MPNIFKQKSSVECGGSCNGDQKVTKNATLNTDVYSK